MNDTPLITCVIPTYRRPRMLARAIKSVLNQTFPRLYVFVTDNASGDETGDVVRAIQAQDSRVIYHCQPENLGMNANFQYGMSHVATPFYSLLSDDDVLLPEFYENAYSEFKKYPQAIFVATQVFAVNEKFKVDSEPLSTWDRTGYFEPPTGAFRIAEFTHPTITGTLFRREFLDTPFAYPDPKIHAGDYEILFNAAYNFPIVTVHKPGALFIQHSNPRAMANDPLSVADHCLLCIKRIDSDERFPEYIKKINRQKWDNYLTGYLRGTIIRSAINNRLDDTKKGLEILNSSLDRGDLVRRLQWLNRLIQTIPASRHVLKPGHYLYTHLREGLRRRKMYTLQPKYQELMKI